MGTHPIFESDFDCLTGRSKFKFSTCQENCPLPKTLLFPVWPPFAPRPLRPRSNAQNFLSKTRMRCLNRVVWTKPTEVLLNVPPVRTVPKELFLSGEETWLTASDTFPPKLLTSPSKTKSRPPSPPQKTPPKLRNSPTTSFPVGSLVLSHSCSSTLLTSPEPN